MITEEKTNNAGGVGVVHGLGVVHKGFWVDNFRKLSNGLGVVHIFGHYNLLQKSKNSPFVVHFSQITVILYGLGVVHFQGFLEKIFGQLWELSGQLPPSYVILKKYNKMDHSLHIFYPLLCEKMLN